MNKKNQKRPINYQWSQDSIYKEGIFLKPHGKWIVRVKKRGQGGFSTLCQFDFQEQAQKFFDDYCEQRTKNI